MLNITTAKLILILKKIKKVIALGVIIFLTYYLFKSIGEIQSLNIAFNYSWLLLSFAVLLFVIINQSLIWFIISRLYNCKIEIRENFIIWNYSNILKYVPGRVLAYAAFYHFYGEKNVSKTNLSLALYIDLIGNVINPFFIFLISFLFIDLEILNSYKVPSLVLIALLLVLIHPRIFIPVMNKALKYLKKDLISLEVKFRHLLAVLLLNVLNWFIYGIAFYMLANSFLTVELNYFFLITCALSLSAVAGFLAFFTPSGLGVREGILILIFNLIFPAPVSALLAILSRLWQVLAEFTLFAMAVLVDVLGKYGILKLFFSKK